jgi:hypothetical protein
MNSHTYQFSIFLKKNVGRKVMKCVICDREAEGINYNYCTYHKKAYENIISKYAVWEKAYEKSWIKYLQEISKNSLTGEWAKEVAKELLKKKDGEKKNVKKN